MVSWWSCRHWELKNRRLSWKSLNSEKGTAWVDTSSRGVIWPFFLWRRRRWNHNIVRYLYILERKVNSALHWTGIYTKQMWFQQDEANPHTTTAWLISYRRHLETGSLHSGLTTIGHHIRFESTRCLPAVIIKGQKPVKL
jgi:hypothetical protein